LKVQTFLFLLRRALLLLAVAALCSAASLPPSKFVFKHHDNNELAEILYDVHNRCPNITRVYALSLPSVEKRPLLVIEFSTKPGHHQLREYSHLFHDAFIDVNAV